MALSSSKSYPHELLPNSRTYQFITDAGVVYVAYFTEADGQFPSVSFAADAVTFNIEPLEDSLGPSSFDARIGATIIDIVAAQFVDNPQAVVCYVCDQADARAFKRAARFNRLYEQGNEGELEKDDIERPPLYASIIYRRDHPARVEIEQAAQGIGNKFSDEE